MNFQDLKIIVGQIKKRIHCPKCKGSYTDEAIEMIGNLGDEQTFFYAYCTTCELEAVINVCIHNDHEGNPYVDEMISPKVEKLGSAPRGGNISTNEVLDMHNYSKEFDGDFSKLFKDKKSQ